MTERDDLRTADLAEQRPGEHRPDPDLGEGTDYERRDEAASREEVVTRDEVVDRDRADDVVDRRDDVVDFDRRDDAVAAERMDADRPAAAGTSAGPLIAGKYVEVFRARWTDIQNGFVDEPRKAVEQADGLTAELMQHLAKTFADERGRLEGQWDRGDDVSTDDLRTAFQRYRSFFERLLSA
jgi:hypothetical protein